jgi:WD40 repeat protein
MRRKLTVTGHSDWITSLTVNNNAKTFVSGSLDSQIKIWDLNSGKCTNTLTMPAPVWGVAFSPSGEHLVGVSQDGTVAVFAMQK